MFKAAIIDDEAIIRRALERLIHWEELGFTLIGSFSSGEEAIQELETQHTDIIITDIYMPGLSGLEFLQRFRDKYNESLVILLTGYAEFDYARQAVVLGAFDYLLKPINAEDIEKVLIRARNTLLKHKQHNVVYTRGNEQLLRDNILRILRREEQDAHEVSVSSCAAFMAAVDISAKCPEEKEIRTFLVEPGERIIEETEGIRVLTIEHVQDSYLGVMFRTEGENPLSRRDSRKVCEVMLENLEEQISSKGVHITISLSSIHSSFSELSDEIHLLRETIELRHILGVDRILHSSLAPEFRHRRKKHIPIPSEQFTKSIRFGHTEQVQKLIEEIYDQILYGRVKTSLMTVRNLSVELALLAFQAGGENGGAEQQEKLLAFLEQLQSLSTVQELKQELLILAVQQSRVQELEQADVQARLANRALEYIHSHYTDSDISLDKVSAALFISAPYLSVLLKQKTGKNFLSYIQEMRIGKAKDMVRRGMAVSEISEELGFSSSQYFSVSFKRFTGMTPSEYRRESRKGVDILENIGEK